MSKKKHKGNPHGKKKAPKVKAKTKTKSARGEGVMADHGWIQFPYSAIATSTKAGREKLQALKKKLGFSTQNELGALMVQEFLKKHKPKS